MLSRRTSCRAHSRAKSWLRSDSSPTGEAGTGSPGSSPTHERSDATVLRAPWSQSGSRKSSLSRLRSGPSNSAAPSVFAAGMSK
nr:hypothetical protein [Embleya hyalina]